MTNIDARNTVRWVAHLSNGQVIYEDPAIQAHWQILKVYCDRNGFHLVALQLQYRSNIVDAVPKNADGYYLSKAVFGVWGEGTTHHAYNCGYLAAGRIHVQRWQTPALQLIHKEIRDIIPCLTSLIAK